MWTRFERPEQRSHGALSQSDVKASRGRSIPTSTRRLTVKLLGQ
jgi:hypothetical protein